MKFILTILFLFSIAYGQMNYYVANNGSDSNDGLTPATAWQTLSKVNSSTFNAGDSILLKRGDSWNERLNIASSGSAGSPIVVGAYGTGVKPLITGLQTLTGFVNTSGNIWTVTASNAVANLNTVLVDGKIRAKGRYPNASAANGGYLAFQSGTQTSITSSNLTGTPNYTGKECVVRTSSWVLDVVKVASQSSSTLNFSTALTYNPTTFGGTGFFFQNDSSFLDIAGEWCIDSTTNRFQIYSLTDPSGNVQVSTIDTLIWLRQKNYLIFDSISFEGANKTAFQLDTSNHITVKNCTINFSGTNAFTGLKSIGTIISNDSIQNSLNSVAYLRQFDPYTPTVNTCDSTTIDGNYIKNTAVYPGMGLNAQGRYTALFVIGAATTIKNNTIDSSGYIPIQFNGVNSIIDSNYVSNFCFVKDDGGGIYTVIGAYIPSDYNIGSVIKKNIVVNGVGATSGTNVIHPSACIYLDNYTKGVTVDSNFLYVGNQAALMLNEADSNILTNNTIINNDTYVVKIVGNNSFFPSGNTFKFNKVYSTSPLVYTMYRSFGTTLGDFDSNYYSRPSNEYLSLQLNNKDYNLTDWQRASGKDLNSHITPPSISKGVAPLIVYNPTLSDSTIYFTGYKRSLDGTDYSGSITLPPFSGAILFEYIPPYKSTLYKHYR